MLQIVCAGVLLTILGYLANRFYFSGGRCISKKRLDGKIVIITGANTGIGKETALDLAKRGAHVIIACRNQVLAQKAVDSIILETNNSKVECEVLDLADLSSVRSFAEKMNSKLNRLDILINNAGIMMCPYWRTKDGFETQFGVNHLGHFLLTNLLLDLLKKSPSSRVINVSSLAHRQGKINWDDINSEKSYNSIAAYGQSKLANVLFTLELSRRFKDASITAVAVHPGAVRTELMRYTGEGIHKLVPILVSLFFPIHWMLTKSAAEGAQTTIHCAVDDSIPDLSGKYFSDCKPKTPTKRAQSIDDASRLWNLSATMVGIE